MTLENRIWNCWARRRQASSLSWQYVHTRKLEWWMRLQLLNSREGSFSKLCRSVSRWKRNKGSRGSFVSVVPFTPLPPLPSHVLGRLTFGIGGEAIIPGRSRWWWCHRLDGGYHQRMCVMLPSMHIRRMPTSHGWRRGSRWCPSRSNRGARSGLLSGVRRWQRRLLVNREKVAVLLQPDTVYASPLRIV